MKQPPARDLINRKDDSRPDRSTPLIDWLAWSLQLVVGFFVGCGIGYQAARLSIRSDLNHTLLLAAGLGLICAAFTSFCGNRAWMAPSAFVAPEPAPPRRAKACSLLIGSAGLVVTLLTVVHSFNAGAGFGRRVSSTDFDLFPMLAALVPGFLVLYAMRTGTGFWIFGIVNREETPLIFWAYVVINLSATLGLLSLIL